MNSQAFLLLSAVVAVGVLHTLVPDHWVPIVVIARQRGWTKLEAARAALVAGSGHTVTTLILGAIVWLAGTELGMRFGHLVDVAASVALIGLGSWIALGSLRQRRRAGQGHSHGGGHSHGHGHHHHHDEPNATTDALYVPLTHAPVADHHAHLHAHGRGRPHLHWHDHDAGSAHAVTADVALSPPTHDHRHRIGAQAWLLILLGSSPMAEGLPAFFAASRYGAGFLALMAVAFAAGTIATYVVLCSVSLAGLERVRLGPLERHGEVLSGVFIACVGLVLLAWPIA